MRSDIGALVVVALVAATDVSRAAAPPAKTRDLTLAEQKEVAALNARLRKHAGEGEFEQAAKVARQIADYRRAHQGARHWQALDARFEIEKWKRLAAVAVKDRAEVMRGRRLNQQGVDLMAEGRYRDAEKPLRQGLQIREKVLGPDHPDTAVSYNNLGFCLDDQGKSAEALPLYRKALHVCEKALGPDHPDVASSNANVALCLLAQGKASEALPLLRQALQTREKVLGLDHPSTATGYNNLAECLNAQGKAAEALPLLRKALQIKKKVLGLDHSSTAMGYDNLAACLNAQGKAAEALPLHRQGLLIREKVLGPDHPGTALSYNNLAGCLLAQGKVAEALPLFKKALLIFEKVLGPDHPDTALGYNNVASCLDDQGKAAEALPLYRKALHVREKVLPRDHPSTAGSYNNVASCLQEQGKSAEALPLFKEALRIREKALGPDHPLTAASYGNAASCLDSLGKSGEALPLFRSALLISENVLGLAHPSTAIGYNNLAYCLWLQDQRSEAVLLWQQSVRGQEAARAMRADSGFERAQGGTHVSVRAALAAALAGAKQPRNAFAHAEASLARGLLDDLASLSKAQRERADDLRVQMARREPILASFSSRGTLSDEQKARQEGAKREYGRLWREWSDLHAEASEAAVLPLERIQRSLPDDGALVLWVAELGERWGCVVRRQGAPIWQKLDRTTADSERARQLYASLIDPSSDAKDREKRLAAFGKERLDPLRPHLKGVTQLFVVPAGDMAHVPAELFAEGFAVRYVPSGSYLARIAENHRALDGSSLLALGDPIFDKAAPPEPPASGVFVQSVLPNGFAAKAGVRAGDVLLSIGKTTLDSIDDLRAALAALPADAQVWREGKTLAVRLQGAPLGATPDKRSARAAVRAWRKAQEATASRGTGHKRLPGTRVEAEAISALVKNSTLLLGSDASEQKLDALLKSGALKKHRLFHFATHGDVVEQTPGRSALILAQDKLPDALEQAKTGDHVYDGRLTVSRIRTEWKGKIDADLVVLSACETGLGKDAKGDGLLGFAQAFLSAGARSVILSRWPVDDVATSLLMRRFYQNLLGKREGLKKPLGRAASLQEAKEWLRSLSAKDAASAIESLPRGKLVAAPKGEGKAYEHPYYWAAFTLIGDPD